METTRFMKVVEMTDEEKFAMYMKLTKAEIVKMHIELERMVKLFSPTQGQSYPWPINYPIYDNSAKPFSPPFIVTSTDTSRN